MRKRQTRRFVRIIVILIVMLIALTLVSMNAGYSDLSAGDIFRILAGGGTAQENLILFDFRLVRITLSILVGAGLSVSGVVFQTISRNALASPDLLGVSAGAGMAVLLYTFYSSDQKAAGILALPFVALAGALAAALLIYRSRDLNLLRLNDGVAIGLGSPLRRHRFVYLMLAVALAAACVSIGGAIGFVGLICPHIARKLVGPNHQYCIPVSALTGALLLLAADLAARTVIAPGELLLGIVVSLIGAPYFLYILITSGN